MQGIKPYIVFFFLVMLGYLYQPAIPGANVETYPKTEIQFPIDLSKWNVKQLPVTKLCHWWIRLAAGPVLKADMCYWVASPSLAICFAIGAESRPDCAWEHTCQMIQQVPVLKRTL